MMYRVSRYSDHLGKKSKPQKIDIFKKGQLAAEQTQKRSHQCQRTGAHHLPTLQKAPSGGWGSEGLTHGKWYHQDHVVNPASTQVLLNPKCFTNCELGRSTH